MLIADHAKKNAPPESYSWKFITDSVSEGIIQVEDKYLIDSPPNEPRSILAGPRAKKTRTPFTTHDDALIAKYVLEEGINTAGNVMYMNLAEKVCLHHSAHRSLLEQGILTRPSTPIILGSRGGLEQ